MSDPSLIILTEARTPEALEQARAIREMGVWENLAKAIPGK